MVTIALSRGPTTGLTARVGTTTPVSLERRSVRTLINRYRGVRLRLTDPGLMFEPAVHDLLHDPPPTLDTVVVGSTTFTLDCRFDALALAWLIGCCADGGAVDRAAARAGDRDPPVRHTQRTRSANRPCTTPVSNA